MIGEDRFYSPVCRSAARGDIKALLSCTAGAGRRPGLRPFSSDKGSHTVASGAEKSFVSVEPAGEGAFWSQRL